MGCHNINFVSPTHFVPQILQSMPHAIEMGLNVPLVYNTGGYDSLATLRLLDGVFDIYMPDFKYSRGEISNKYSRAPDYPQVAEKALEEMFRQVGNLKIDEQGIAFRGLRCEVCFNICPVRNKAITLELQHNKRSGKHALFIPVVHSDHCTGCGLCEKACILEEAAIKVFPMHLAKGELGGHYRLGWQEKEKAGKALVTPDLEHKYNLPEGVRYDLQGEGLIIDQQAPKETPFSSNPLDTLNKGQGNK